MAGNRRLQRIVCTRRAATATRVMCDVDVQRTGEVCVLLLFLFFFVYAEEILLRRSARGADFVQKSFRLRTRSMASLSPHIGQYTEGSNAREVYFFKMMYRFVSIDREGGYFLSLPILSPPAKQHAWRGRRHHRADEERLCDRVTCDVCISLCSTGRQYRGGRGGMYIMHYKIVVVKSFGRARWLTTCWLFSSGYVELHHAPKNAYLFPTPTRRGATRRTVMCV